MPLLSARALTKSYAGVRALDSVSLDVEAGEIHALVGENGAGKSTFIKICTGAVAPDSGSVELDGRALPPGDPLAVRHRGVSIVYQEFTLVPDLSVADNIFLGRELGRVWLRRADAMKRAQTLLDELGVAVDAGARVRGLSVAQQQMIEIARALVGDARVLILDEPSATLSAPELERLFAVLRRLRAKGLGIIYISHRLEEVFALADRITVLRDGKHVTTTAARGVDRAQLIRWMVGRDVAEEFPKRAPSPGDEILAVDRLAAPPRFTAASFAVREGEIVGLAGLVGSGRTSTALAIIGAIPSVGTIRFAGRPARFRSPHDAIRAGVSYVTEDRKARGIFPLLGTDTNITISTIGDYARFGMLSTRDERRAAASIARAFDVRASSLTQPIATLSGGNQQKALLARYLLRRGRVVILDEPTRGVDVGARAEIYALMNCLTDEGLGVLMISSDLPEVLGMADRICVMRGGRMQGELRRAEATPESVMTLATAS